MFGPAGHLNPILEVVSNALPPAAPVYLVGGAVRDLLTGRPVHDLDFALPSRAIPAARKVANALSGAFFPLDSARDTGRVIVTQSDGARLVLDFTAFRGPDLESDLRDRDFTVNAIAVDLRQPDKLVDPLGGAADLRLGLLRPCSEQSFLHDPIRILRLVRQAVGLELKIPKNTLHLARQALPGLANVSTERVRDEIFRILDLAQPATALRLMDMLGVLPAVLPEMEALKSVRQSPPHIDDAWPHTVGVVQQLAELLAILGRQHDPEAAASWASGMLSIRLGRYRQQIYEHLNTPLNPDRQPRSLLLLAALYHDAGKASTRQENASGAVRFIGHDQAGAQLVCQRGEALHLSNLEIERLQRIVQQHMRPLLLAHDGSAPSRRAVYRFFRDTGPAGVDICLLSLADTLATYGPALPKQTWLDLLDTVRILLEAWWEQPEQRVDPPPLVDGRQLMTSLGLQPGPLVGQLLEAIREAQAAGEIQDGAQALALARAEYQNLSADKRPTQG